MYICGIGEVTKVVNHKNNGGLYGNKGRAISGLGVKSGGKNI